MDSATDLDFGTVDFVNGNTGQSTITYRCTAGTAPTASLDWDVMTGGVSGQLDYNLYSDAGYSNDWDTTNTVSLPAAAGLSTAETVNVYGRITSTQATANTVQVGSYSDDVTVTLTF